MGKRLDKFEKATEYVTKSTKFIILIIGSIVAIGCAIMYGLNELGIIGNDDEYYEEEASDETVSPDDSTYYYGEDVDSTYADSTYVDETE